MTEELSLEASLSAAYDRMQQPEAPTATSETAPESPSATRDERGRFVGKRADSTEIPAVEALDAPADDETPDTGTEPAAEPAEQPLSPPERWSAEDKAAFAALPREAQQIVLKRESDVERHLSQKAQEAANIKRQYEPLDQLLAPRRQAWASQGVSEAAVIGRLFEISDYADQDPAGFIKWYAEQRGLNLQQLTAPQGAGAAPAAPNATGLPPELQPVLQKVQSIEQRLHQQQLAEQQRQQQEISQQIEAFKAAPGHELFDEVRSDMARLIAAGAASNLTDAYEKAVWANPATRARLMESGRKAAEQKRIDEAKAAAAKAKKAAGTQLTPKSTIAGQAAPSTSWEETLSATYDRLVGAA